jgi:hypothetical protein
MMFKEILSETIFKRNFIDYYEHKETSKNQKFTLRQKMQGDYAKQLDARYSGDDHFLALKV